MHFLPFKVPKYNAHYEGAYDEREMRWRQVCARDKARNLECLLGNEEVSELLEVGCGTGAVVAELARRNVGLRHVGVDVADPNEHVDPNAAHSMVQFMRYDGERLPFAAQSFDLVFASHVVEHVPNPRGFIHELARVARRAIYLEVPCEIHIRVSRESLQRTLDIGHINAYTPESFALLVQTCGIEIMRTRLFDHSLDVHAFNGSMLRARAKHLLRRSLLLASPLIASRCFTYHFGVLCRPPATSE